MKPTHIRCVSVEEEVNYLTEGKVYEILGQYKQSVDIIDDNSSLIYVFMTKSSHGKFNYIHPSVKNPK